MKKRLTIISAIALVFMILCYLSLGLFIIQPIGAVPDGATVVYFRLGTSLPFVASADGILLKKVGEVSLLTRAMMMAGISKPVMENKIFVMPYSKALYLYSTDGVELEK